MNTLMVNAYYDYDFDAGANFTPYVSLGVDAAFLKYKYTGLIVDGDNSDANVDSKSKTHFAYAAGIGTLYKISENWSADVIACYIFMVIKLSLTQWIIVLNQS